MVFMALALALKLTFMFALRINESSMRYEPYLVIPMSRATPLYEETFVGYGKNKIQHTIHLRARGFRFHVLSLAFLIHYPHSESQSRVLWSTTSNGLKPEEFLLQSKRRAAALNGTAAVRPYSISLRRAAAKARDMRKLMDLHFNDFLLWVTREYGLDIDQKGRIVAEATKYCTPAAKDGGGPRYASREPGGWQWQLQKELMAHTQRSSPAMHPDRRAIIKDEAMEGLRKIPGYDASYSKRAAKSQSTLAGRPV